MIAKKQHFVPYCGVLSRTCVFGQLHKMYTTHRLGANRGIPVSVCIKEMLDSAGLACLSAIPPSCIPNGTGSFRCFSMRKRT